MQSQPGGLLSIYLFIYCVCVYALHMGALLAVREQPVGTGFLILPSSSQESDSSRQCQRHSVGTVAGNRATSTSYSSLTGDLGLTQPRNAGIVQSPVPTAYNAGVHNEIVSLR